MDRACAGRGRGAPGRRGRRVLAAAAGERGVALILVICTVGILLLLGLSLLIVISADMRGAVRERDRLRAFYIAEGGLERAMFVLTGDLAWRAGETAPLGAGQYIVTLSDEPPDMVRITSRGEAGSQARTLVALVRAGGGAGGPFDFALFSADSFNFKYNAVIQGDMHVNGNVQNNGDVVINGRLTLSGDLNDKGNLVATEGIVEGAPEIPAPEYDEQWYRDNATISMSGTRTINGGVYDDDIVFIDGRLNLRGLIQGSVTFVCSGQINVTGNLTRVDPSDEVFIMSTSKIAVDGPARVEATLWSPLKIEIRGAAVTISGTVVGGNVQVEAQNLVLLNDSSFGTPPGTPPGGGGIELVEWQEGG